MRAPLHSATFTTRAGAANRPCGRRGVPRSAAFTVLELLIVVGVLSILLSIVLPTIKSVRASALRNRAKVQATALAQAAIRYKNEYGFWPGQLQVKSAADDTVELREAFKSTTWLSAIISRHENTAFTVTTQGGSTAPVYIDENWAYQSFRRIGEKSGETYRTNPLNPKGIHFLDLANESDTEEVRYPDPWGREFILVMGLNPRSTFTHTVIAQNSGTAAHTVSVSNTIAFAFSYGPDGLQSTNYIYSAGVTP